MQKRPSVVYIRHRPCQRKNVRCGLLFVLVWMFMLCIGIRLLWSLIWAGVATVIFRCVVFKRMR